MQADPQVPASAVPGEAALDEFFRRARDRAGALQPPLLAYRHRCKEGIIPAVARLRVHCLQSEGTPEQILEDLLDLAALCGSNARLALYLAGKTVTAEGTPT